MVLRSGVLCDVEVRRHEGQCGLCDARPEAIADEPYLHEAEPDLLIFSCENRDGSTLVEAVIIGRCCLHGGQRTAEAPDSAFTKPVFS